METSEEAELCFPQLLNASCVKPRRPHYESVLICILLFSFSLLTASLNLLLIVSVSHFKQLHTPTNLLLLSLALSDFLMGLLMFFQTDGCWLLGDLMCTLCQCLAYIVSSVAVGTMVLVSVDRYVAVCDPLHYSTKLTLARVKMSVCLCWICSVIYQTLYLRDNLQQPGRFNSCIGECVIYINYTAGLVDVVVSFVAPITIIVVLYVRVFVVAVTQARAFRSHVAAASLQRSVKASQQRSVKAAATRSELKAARTLGVVIVVFLMCLCPYYCVSLVGQDSLLRASSAAFVIYLYYFNSCINPVIYAFLYPWFRKSIKLIVTLKILQQDSCEANML